MKYKKSIRIDKSEADERSAVGEVVRSGGVKVLRGGGVN